MHHHALPHPPPTPLCLPPVLPAAGLIKDAGTNQLQLSPGHFGKLAHKACAAKDLGALPGVFPKVRLPAAG